MSTISEVDRKHARKVIESAVPNIKYTVLCSELDLIRAWKASNKCKDHHINIISVDRTLITFKVRRRRNSDEYTGDALQVAIALAGLCTVGYVALGWFLS